MARSGAPSERCSFAVSSRHRVEQALLLLQARGALLGRAGLAEHPLEGHARVDADRQRARVVAPGERVEERAREAVAGARPRCPCPRCRPRSSAAACRRRPCRRCTGRRSSSTGSCRTTSPVPSRWPTGPDAVQERRAGAQVDRGAPRRLHLADRDQLIAERLERLHDRLELEVAAGLRPDATCPGYTPFGHVDRAEPERRRRGRVRLRGERRHHRVEQRQRDRGAERAAQERAAGQMLLRDDHGYSVSLRFVRPCVDRFRPVPSLVRIWNGALSTIPMMIDAKR